MSKKKKTKPLELYYFIDPINPDCWSLEPVIKKLQIKFGEYFSLRYILTGNISTWNIPSNRHRELAAVWETAASRSGMSCDGALWLESPIHAPYKASVAVKAAEMQGQQAGIQFLRKIQEAVFIRKQDVTDIDVLVEIAKSIGLDIEEFKQDLSSAGAAKAFQCDLKISREMHAEFSPSIVFFNQNISDPGLKISGIYSYSVYKQIISEKLGFTPNEAPLPDIVSFLRKYGTVASTEISEVYDMKENEVTFQMNKIMKTGLVEKIPAKHCDFWKLCICLQSLAWLSA